MPCMKDTKKFTKNKKNKTKTNRTMKKNNSRKKKSKQPKFMSHIVSIVIFFVIISFIGSLISKSREDIKDVSLSSVASEVIAGEVKEIVVMGDELRITLLDESKQVAKKEREASLSETLSNYGVTPESLSLVSIEIKDDKSFGAIFIRILPILLPVAFILIFFWFISKQSKGGMQAFSFGQSKARVSNPNDKNRVTFKDIAGAKEAKNELEEIVEFLKFPKKFIDIGAQIPKGVLLAGPSGTGKTLLARAVAGEARVPFYHLSGSEFVEMFVGVGASRVRDLFKQAKKTAPAIIFIDEIDAVGRVRGTGVGGGNDEREQTLNQILVEMDGFEPNEKVIIIGATNRQDVLDPALLRPGRFDRKVMIDLPDREGREAIMKIHARKKPLAKDVDLTLLATRTPGFSGADLYSLMNEGAILAARKNRTEVTQDDLLRSIEKVMIGPERQSHMFTKKEREITAYHEAGHALVASVLPYADPVHKISIIPRGRAGGYTLKLPIEERKLQSKKEFIDDLAMSLGGYVAEEMVFGDITTGPSNDLQVSTNLARAMVTRWGMSEHIGPIALESDGGTTLFGRGVDNKSYSEDMSRIIDGEVKKLMHNALDTARAVLTEHRVILNAISKKLMEEEVLEQDEYEKILIEYGIKLKKA
ncbi:MAG: cell division protease FtsH [Flavobacteriaceae bacterium]|jgi:cell division protease FtsH